ncbi:PDZ domain-containing protein [Salinifilum aidingensis]
MLSVGLVIVFGLLGAVAPVPYVALGPGPTYDTLGTDGDAPVIRIKGERTYPTEGHLNMTTVSVTDRLSLFSALSMWASGRYALTPREVYFPPGKSEREVEKENTAAFNASRTTAETAALGYLGYPTEVVVGQVVGGSPAEGVLKPGDAILRADGDPVRNARSLHEALSDTNPGDRVDIRYQREGQPERNATVRLAERPHGQDGQNRQGFLGVQAQKQADVDFAVDISLADVGGPSAGLMFSLAIIDKLTPGQLAGGEFVAGTGEITPAGEVGPIGGIRFKMTKAREAGATTFLVPAGNCSEAAAQAPEGMQLAKVGTLDDAVRALDAVRAGKQPRTC